MNRFYFTNKDNPEKTCYEVLGMVMQSTGLAVKGLVRLSKSAVWQ